MSAAPPSPPAVPEAKETSEPSVVDQSKVEKQEEQESELIGNKEESESANNDGASSNHCPSGKADPKDDDANESQPTEKLSKKAMKRKRRWEHKLAVKKRRKEHEKDARRAKAILEGRDLEEEHRDREERTKKGEGRARRDKLLMDRIQSSADKSFQVCLDCAFEDEMTNKEINSLSSQIRYCYAVNKRSPNPVYLSVTSLAGTTRSVLDKVDGFPDNWRGFKAYDKSMEDALDTSKLVYLTSDSPNVLEEPENDKIYVIGGIVDRNRLKRATIDRAEALGIGHAKLPISQHLKLFSTQVLTCNHVFEILLKYRDCEKDWKKAMLEVLPKRKDLIEK